MDGIVKKLTEERKKRGISQAKLAQMCGMPQSTVGRIESGAVAPNISTVEHMAGALGLDLSVEEKRPQFAAGWDGLHAMCYWKDEPVSEIYVRGNDVTVKRFTHHPV